MKSKTRQRTRRVSKDAFRKQLQLAIEPLEQRSMLALVLPPGTALGTPLFNYANLILEPGSLTYNAATDAFVMQARPANFKLTDASAQVPVLSTTRSLTINLNVDAAGNLQPGGTL